MRPRTPPAGVSAIRLRIRELVARRISVTSGVRTSSQISALVERPDFDLARSRHRIGAALHPGDRLVDVLDVPEPEAGDQLAGRREGPVDNVRPGPSNATRLPCEEGLKIGRASCRE